MSLFDTRVKIDPELKKFIRSGSVKGAYQKAIRRSLVETSRFAIKESAKTLKQSKVLNRAVKSKYIKKGIRPNPKKIPASSSIDNSNSFVSIEFSSQRQNLWRIPFKTKTKTITRKGRRGVVKQKVGMILTSVYNRGFKLDPLKPFWSGYSYKKKPRAQQMPIALYRKSSSRHPLAVATAPSLSELILNTQIDNKVTVDGTRYFERRFDHNVGYYIGRVLSPI